MYINKLYYKVAELASKIVTNICNMGTITAAQARRKKVLLLPSQYSLVQIVRRVICADMSGATVQELRGGSVMVTDCPSWRQEQTSLLMLLRPNVSISITSCCSSLSGFSVSITEAKTASAASARALFALTVAGLACAFACSVFLYGPLYMY